jgi:hypothetical protein
MGYIKAIVGIICFGALIWGYLQWGEYAQRQAFEARIGYSPNEQILYDEPLQIDITPQSFTHNDHMLEAVAEFTIEALALSVKSYSSDDMASISPVDIAVGWGQMADPETILGFSKIRQGGRYFAYRWENAPPVDPQRIITSASNIHLVPANEDVAEKLEDIERADFIRLEGYLVNITRNSDGKTWRTSTTRTDTRRGACEILYVQAVNKL